MSIKQTVFLWAIYCAIVIMFTAISYHMGWVDGRIEQAKVHSEKCEKAVK